MLLNEPQLSYRSPRLCLLVNGQVLTGAYEVLVRSNNYYSADSFNAVFALGADPWADLGFWSSVSGVRIDVQLSVDNGESFTSLLVGLVDMVSIDPIEGVARIAGRDLAAALIEAKTQETFANRTSSEIATIFAQRHDLVPRVVPTSTPIGRFYQSDHEGQTLNRFSNATTEWDFLAYLARQESYDTFVTGTVLCFQPAIRTPTIDLVLHPTDMTELRLERAVTLARDIQVTVRSWNSLQQMAFTGAVRNTLTSNLTNAASSAASTPREYVVVRPNLTPDMALTIAKQQLSEVSRHERGIEFSMPGELTLTPRSMILLDGTGTDFDQVYYINSIDRSFTRQTGFLQRIRASNSSPRTEIAPETVS